MSSEKKDDDDFRSWKYILGGLVVAVIGYVV